MKRDQSMGQLSWEESMIHNLRIGIVYMMLKDCSLSASRSLVSTLPQRIRSKMGMKLQGNDKPGDSGQMVHKVAITSREEAALCIQKVLRRLVMVSSAEASTKQCLGYWQLAV